METLATSLQADALQLPSEILIRRKSRMSGGGNRWLNHSSAHVVAIARLVLDA